MRYKVTISYIAPFEDWSSVKYFVSQQLQQYHDFPIKILKQSIEELPEETNTQDEAG